MKFVGIDFGHGEVSASYYDGIRLERLRLVRTTSTNEEEFKLPSYLYKCLKADGTFRYDIQEHNPCTLLSEMKKPIDQMTDTEKMYYREFVKLVYERLLELNNEILGTNDFELAIACPTKWDAVKKMAYKGFFEQALGRNIYALMNESDAAYFAKKDDTNTPTLVVDYGSSTIDFTCVCNGEKLENLDQESSLLGASYIENILLNIYKNDEKAQPSYQDVERRVNPVLKVCHREWINLDGFLKADLREMKENMFSLGRESLKGKIYLSAYEHIGRDELKGVCYEYAYEGKLLEMDGIKQYEANVKTDFATIKRRIEGYQVSVQKIILSGGASCMPWVKEALKEVFELNDQQIVIDNHPSFVVCDGIVKYCYYRQKCLDEFLDEVRKIGVVGIVKSSNEQAKTRMRKPLLYDVIEEYAMPEYHRTTMDNLIDDILRKCFLAFNEENEDYTARLNSAIKANAVVQISQCLNAIMEKMFHKSANMEDYKAAMKDFPKEALVKLRYDDEDGTIEFIRDKIKDVVKSRYYTFGTGIILNIVTYDKQRTLAERKEIAQKLKVDAILSQFLDIEKELDPNLSNETKEKLKNFVLAIACYLFDEMELFKTRFTI